MSEASATDFRSAIFTAIVSDLHLCEAQELHPEFPLWKKYKTRQFFYDDVFADFTRHIQRMAGNEKIELVLNGDIFDFDSVMTIPKQPLFRVSFMEAERGLNSEEEKSVFKMQKILDDHDLWIRALRDFILAGHRVVFVMGNHDLELHWPAVQSLIRSRLEIPVLAQERLRFTEWFYISNQDTLIEHGNQYDPYCLCFDPVSPFIRNHNRVEIRLPFGNIACRYMINGMGFFNPHVDAAYIMSLREYLDFFMKYMVRSQPFIVWTWFWGSFATLIRSLADTLRPAMKDPLRIEDRINEIAERSNATPRMVREMKELFANPATQSPVVVARELWLDRAFLIVVGLFLLFEIFLFIKQVFAISMFWMFIPILILVPFFLFYSRVIRSNVAKYKEPQETILGMATQITQTQRVVYGHTHIVRHEVIGAVEHLNSGCWSPAFLDVECTKPVGQKTFIWIQPSQDGSREARVYHFTGGESVGVFNRRSARRPKRLSPNYS